MVYIRTVCSAVLAFPVSFNEGLLFKPSEWQSLICHTKIFWSKSILIWVVIAFKYLIAAYYNSNSISGNDLSGDAYKTYRVPSWSALISLSHAVSICFHAKLETYLCSEQDFQKPNPSLFLKNDFSAGK